MKKFQILVVILFILFLFTFCKKEIVEPQEESYEWNGGYCSLDGGRLHYINTGSMNHYQCEICGKEYVFKGVNKYE